MRAYARLYQKGDVKATQEDRNGNSERGDGSGRDGKGGNVVILVVSGNKYTPEKG